MDIEELNDYVLKDKDVKETNLFVSYA
jgi:hypothetical protein